MLPLCFVTGASGFVGRHLVPKLAQRYRLRLLVRPGQELPQFANLDHERCEGRLDSATTLANGVRGCDLVVHLAALVSFRAEDRAAMQSINVDATAALAAAARAANVRRFLHMSTISAVAYRDRPELADETATYNFAPLHIGYCDTKFAAERAVLSECARGLDAVIVNPPSMYGAGDRCKGDDSLLTAVLRGKIRMCPPGGINVANVDDVCDGVVAAIERGRSGERYLLGGENLTGALLLQRIANVIGARAPRHTLPRFVVRSAELLLRAKERAFGSRPPLTSEILRLGTRFLWFDSNKAATELGWRAGSVDPGIAAAWRELQAADSQQFA